MKKVYVLSAIFLASILILSCRQDDEDVKEEEAIVAKAFSTEETSKQEDSTRTMMSLSDSIGEVITPTDPPKSGTHWKLIDSVNIKDQGH